MRRRKKTLRMSPRLCQLGYDVEQQLEDDRQSDEAELETDEE